MTLRTAALSASASVLLALAATAACSQPTPPVKDGEVVVFGDWHADAPGVRHRITVADLGKASRKTAASQSRVIPANGALPRTIAGLAVAEYAAGLETPRAMRVAPNGDVFVAEQSAGRIRVLRAGAGGARPEQSASFVEGLEQPFGIGFYPADNPQWVYVAEINRVVRYPYQAGDLKARGPAQVVIPQLAKTGGGHWTRDLAFSNDGKRLYVSVGSTGNLGEGMDRKSPADAAAWDAAHGLGAAWGPDENRADLLVADPDGKGLKVYAAGIRNCSGLTVQPATGLPWCSVNERDMLGDDLVPDYVTSVKEGAFYGWPWYWLGDNEDPRKAGERPDLKGKVTVPDVLLQAHSAAVQVMFYEGSALPGVAKGSALVSLHGSWNRSSRTGYKVVLVPMADGKPTGEYVDFLTGFVANDAEVWGRPYGLATLKDGSLLVSDDANGRIFRVTAAK